MSSVCPKNSQEIKAMKGAGAARMARRGAGGDGLAGQREAHRRITRRHGARTHYSAGVSDHKHRVCAGRTTTRLRPPALPAYRAWSEQSTQ